MSHYLGIDFSGNYRKWGARCRSSNVWVARVEGDASLHTLTDLRIVQDLPGATPPFDRLAELLRAGQFDAAGIDAPFALPAAHMSDNHAQLLHLAASAPRDKRPFPSAADFLASLTPPLPPRGPKVYRETEDCWRKQGVNTRSTVWAGPRGGTAMTAACLMLLHAAQRPVWPWARTGPGLIVEAFPAAQLKAWGLPHQKYNGSGAVLQDTRHAIVDGLGRRIELAAYRGCVLANADALDAVVAAFAAIAVSTNRLASLPGSASAQEGWIAVHD